MTGNFGESIRAYRPTKTVWFWSTAASIALTMIVGFTFGGWVTGGSATERAETAAENATIKLAAQICAYRFLAEPDAGIQLTALKEKRTYERDSFLEDGGWVTFAGADKPIPGAGALCAEQLAEVELAAEMAPLADAVLPAEATAAN